MTLQQPQRLDVPILEHRQPILCHKCGAEIQFRKDIVGPKGRKIPLDPFFNFEPHAQHCMYANMGTNPDLEPLLFDFLSKVPRKKRVIGAVGRAK
jgi:hypothetical protein